MKINLPTRINWCKIMKVTFSQLLIALIFTGISYAGTTEAQSVLNRKVNISINNISLERALQKLEESTNAKFIYSETIINTDQQVSIEAKEETLKNVLNQLLNPIGISYRLINNRIVLGRNSGMKRLIDLKEWPLKNAIPQAVIAKVVQGKVSNNNGTPLIGVTVQVKSTGTGTITDKNGHYSINVAEADDSLVFTYIGYTRQEVAVNGRSDINVTMQESASELNQLVVIGYQSVQQKDLTGAASVVNTENSNKIISNSLGTSLQGLTPGLTARSSGNPGAASILEIRGIGSFGNSTPLYVIDGMLTDANNITINTDDIASIQVLKDASAAAIYGSRAGNGVVIITTKHGKGGPPQINVSAKYGMQQIPKRWDVMNASQYLNTVAKQYQNSGINPPTGITAQINNPTINTDWQNVVFRTGNEQDYNLSVSGGSKSSNYFLGGSYYKDQGDVIANDLQRPSLRINTKASKGIFTIGENMMISNTTVHAPSGVNVFNQTPIMLPIIAVKGDQYNSIPYNPAGWGIGTTDLPSYANSYVANSAINKNKDNYSKIVGNVYAELKIAKWLTYKFNMGAEVSFDYHKTVGDTGIWRYASQPGVTRISEDRELFTNFLLEHTLNFNKSFGLHSINGVIGFSRTQEKRTATNASRTHLQRANGDVFTTINSALGDPSAGGDVPIFWRSHGYLGRINYAYADKYLLTLTGRIDQDSRFGKDYQTGYFPSGAVAWRISKENFFKVSWINDLKVRASYGKLGFSAVLGSWDYLGTLNSNPRAVYGAGQGQYVGEYQAAIVNTDIHWETRIQKDIGFDARLLDNKISLTVDLYNSLSKEVLINLPLPNYLGSSGSAIANTGSIRNSGIEVNATYHHNEGAFKWSVSANATTIKNEVLSVGNQGVSASGNKVNYLQPTDFIRAQVGHSIGEWYVIKTDGIFQSQAEIDNYVGKNGIEIQPDAKPGDIKYIDANGDGTINDDDRQFAGSPWPTFQSGAQFNASYKNFNINIQLIGIFGNVLYDGVRQILDGYEFNNFRNDINPWSPTNKQGTDPRLIVDDADHPTASINNMGQTSRWLENGSYVRVNNIQIGYSFPKTMLDAIGFSKLELYISGQNLLTLTKYDGMDPDVRGNGILQRGFDSGNWPDSRVISVGLNLGF